MIAVLFEVELEPNREQEYLDWAALLRSALAQIDGFVSIERFRSIAEPSKLLSLSYWRDEEAVVQWRNLDQHREAQSFGRAELFADYTIRVAQVMRDYGKTRRAEAPPDSRDAHE